MSNNLTQSHKYIRISIADEMKCFIINKTDDSFVAKLKMKYNNLTLHFNELEKCILKLVEEWRTYELNPTIEWSIYLEKHTDPYKKIQKYTIETELLSLKKECLSIAENLKSFGLIVEWDVSIYRRFAPIKISNIDMLEEARKIFVNSWSHVPTIPIVPKQKTDESDRVCKFSIKNMPLTQAHKKFCKFQHISLCPKGTTCTNSKCNEYHTDSNGKNNCFGYNNCKYFTNCKYEQCEYCHPYSWYAKFNEIYPSFIMKWDKIMVLRNKINNEAKK